MRLHDMMPSVSRMYWGDASLGKIECANLDGTGRTTLLTEASSHYYAFTLSPTYIYFTDWNFMYVSVCVYVNIVFVFDTTQG